ncbi:CPBP family glutamic-type intramembrane protease [Emticicia soli]|uniref:Type II CAAX prenyl endopeptidase Rce1 family protein n=1 Tax=Emticicia soli TaxID=2027878 RepID=A0ABW5J742_9BACT
MKQLIAFFSLSYGISWLIWFPLYGHLLGIPKLPIVPYHHALGALGPLIASFISTYIYSGSAGVKGLLGQCFKIKPFVYVLIALLSPFILMAIAVGMSYVINHKPIDLSAILSSKEFPGFNLLSFFIYNLIFFGFGEEVGWRGFALPRLQANMSALNASILLTLFWALWHWPLFFYRPSFMGMGFGGTIGWVFSLLTGSVLLTWLYNSSRASILVCAIFHSTVDIAFTADFSDQNIMNYMGMLITVWGILTIVIFKPAKLRKNN